MSKRINAPDTQADLDLRACLDKSPRESFIMIAGAGSGKTTSLVKALHHIVVDKGASLRRQGQQVACITYTEIAAAEIWHDVGNNPLVHVSTIHSFLWTIIRPFQADIKKWVLNRVDTKLSELRETAQNFGPRVQQRTKEKNARDQEKYGQLGTVINSVPSFSYGTGSNYPKGILGHDDIIKMVPELIQAKPMLRSIISQKYPYVFVDESQDTFGEIVTALKMIDYDHSTKFCLGFFGDPMQKIYATGVGEIQAEQNWVTIKKPENFRCSQKVLKTINAIRREGDGLEQTRGRTIKENGKDVPVEGSAQIFILPADHQRTDNLKKVQAWCANRFKDETWLDENQLKILVIVHRMAATRLKFPNLYAAMNDGAPSGFKEGLLDGSSWPLRPLVSFLLPLVDHARNNRGFEVLNLLREYCPTLSKEQVKGHELPQNLRSLKEAIDKLVLSMETDSQSNILDVLRIISENEIFTIDSRIIDHMKGVVQIAENENDEQLQLEIEAMQRFFACPANELWGYKTYIDDASPFATQQGVKGAEFERVITILDDDEGTHTHFSYDKYFGVTNLSARDNENIAQGKDSVIDRTRRLFYVSCSRARKDLVIIYYTQDINAAVAKLRTMNLLEDACIHTIETLN